MMDLKIIDNVFVKMMHLPAIGNTHGGHALSKFPLIQKVA